MPSCEKCWRDSKGAYDEVEEYRRLISVRNCTPEEQAGDGTECPECHRMSVHMYCRVCMNPECRMYLRGLG